MGNTFVATVDLSLTSKLRADLVAQGFVLSQPLYTIFAAKKKGVACTLYTSGKITIQGKDKDDFIAYYIEPEILQSLPYTHPEIGIDLTPHIGVDEAGKGDFFGPLCIAGVQADEKTIYQLLELGVKDSKAMPDTTILALAPKICIAAPHTLLQIFPTRYNALYTDFLNLNHLLAWGHATAIADLVAATGCTTALIDQFTTTPLVEQALGKKNTDVHLTQRPRAESDPVVAAASIVARAAFITGIDRLSKEVGFELPKGASSLVIAAGRRLVAQCGREALTQFGKLHFKTYFEIVRS